ncbi:MAG: hypothetical protein ACU84Q_13885 [Gammaproteobacteria bacterium]
MKERISNSCLCGKVQCVVQAPFYDDLMPLEGARLRRWFGVSSVVER